MIKYDHKVLRVPQKDGSYSYRLYLKFTELPERHVFLHSGRVAILKNNATKLDLLILSKDYDYYQSFNLNQENYFMLDDTKAVTAVLDSLKTCLGQWVNAEKSNAFTEINLFMMFGSNISNILSNSLIYEQELKDQMNGIYDFKYKDHLEMKNGHNEIYCNNMVGLSQTTIQTPVSLLNSINWKSISMDMLFRFEYVPRDETRPIVVEDQSTELK